MAAPREAIRRLRRIAVCVLLAGVLGYAIPWSGLPGPAHHALFILVLAGGLWVTEAIPGYAVGLLIIAMEIVLLGRPDGAFADGDRDRWQVFVQPWASPVMWLFFGSFVLAGAAEKTGLDRTLATRVLGVCGARPAAVLFGVMAITFTFSMFVSNTATTAMMVTVLGPLVHARDRNARTLLLGVAAAANIGGMATVIGTPPNAIAAAALHDVQPIDFAQWMLRGLPPALLLGVLGYGYLVRLMEPGVLRLDASTVAVGGTGRGHRVLVVFVFLGTVLMWLTEPWHGVPATVVAIMPIALLTAAGTLDSEDIRRLPWDVLLLLAGSLALGVGVSETGLTDWMARGLPAEAGIGTLAVVFAIAALVLSNFISNTAAANMLIPLAVTAGAGSEQMVVIPLALCASAAMCLPVSTPPNALVASVGRLKPGEFVPLGLLIGFAAPLLATAWVSWIG